MIAVELLPGQILIVPIAEGYSRARQHIVDAAGEAGLLGFGIAECAIEGRKDVIQPLAISFGIALSRTRPELTLADKAAKIVLGTSPQEHLEHAVSGPSARGGMPRNGAAWPIMVINRLRNRIRDQAGFVLVCPAEHRDRQLDPRVEHAPVEAIAVIRHQPEVIIGEHHARGSNRIMPDIPSGL